MGRLDTGLSTARTVLSLRLAPVLLLAWVIVWPLAGFPWWPIVFVLALGVLLRLLGFGHLIAGKRGPVLLVGLLVATTLFSWSPWAIATGLGAALAGRGLFRLPQWQLLAAGLVLAVGAGSGWTVEVLTARANAAALAEQQAEYYRALLLPGDTRQVLGGLMAAARENDPIGGCSLFTEQAQAQLAQVWGAPDCAGAFAVWHSKVTVRQGFHRYDISVFLDGDVGTLARDGQTATLTACGLTNYDVIQYGSFPVGGPADIGRMQMQRVHGQGFRITDFRPC